MITWITESIATASFTELDAAIHQSGLVADVRDLVDKGGNCLESLNLQIDHAENILSQRGKVYVVCDMGVSRSRVIALGLLTRLGWSFNEALSHIRKVANKPEINLSLLRTLSQHLKSRANDNDTPPPALNSILILGGGGFVGSHLRSVLSVDAIVQSPRSSQINLVTDSIELSQFVEREGCKTIVYAAHPKSYHSSAAFASSLGMLKNALDIAKEHKLKFVYISSMVVFAGNAKKASRNNFAADESIVTIPYGTYSESKFFGEYLVKLYAQNYGLETLVVRASRLYGPKMSGTWLIPKLIKKALMNLPITTHQYLNGLPEFELLHIKDFCAAIELLLRTEDIPPVVHVGSSQTISTYDLARTIIELCESTSSLTLSEINDEIQNIVSAPSPIMRQLGWKPTVPLETGLKELISLETRDFVHEM